MRRFVAGGAFREVLNGIHAPEDSLATRQFDNDAAWALLLGQPMTGLARWIGVVKDFSNALPVGGQRHPAGEIEHRPGADRIVLADGIDRVLKAPPISA